MHPQQSLSWWLMLPFGVLVLAIALLPLIAPRIWGTHRAQLTLVAACAVPVAGYLLATGHHAPLLGSVRSYVSFVVTVGALYVTASGVYVSGDLEATPRTNLTFLLVGSALASLIGTTGASILLLRPVLRTNRQRTNRGHIVPLFIIAVSNAGGLLTPLGDPPLFLGYLEGVPFTWTLRLFPYWLLYVASTAGLLYVLERKACANEPAAAKVVDRTQVEPIRIRGVVNLVLLLAIVGAVLLPFGFREGAVGAIAALSYLVTSRELHRMNEFSLGPIVEVAVLFAGLFICLVPIEHNLTLAAGGFPLNSAWQLFWGAGALSAVLDNAPTYAAFSALARGLCEGQPDLVAGITPIKLAAISVGSVVMGATTYIGNGPNLMVRSIAERSHYRMPSFARYAAFSFVVLLPMHLVTTLILVLCERL